MAENKFKLVGLGEVLWDIFPTGKMLGGASANFAYISNQLGNQGIIASKIGKDTNGNEILQTLEGKGIDASYLQIDEEKLTGVVNVFLLNGQPSYEIIENVAWDFLEFSESWQNLAKNCDAVCFGSLAQRNAVSRKTIQDFVSSTKPSCLRIFDVNLRQNFYTKEILERSLQLANILKLNQDELPVLAEMFDIKGFNPTEQILNLREKFNLDLVCLTLGGDGSILVSADEISVHRGFKVKLVDAVGAGDAFTATMANGVLQGWDLKKINESANKIGAFVASQKGAMPSFEQLKLL